MKSKVDVAERLFVDGFSCAQSVMAPFCEGYGMDMATGLKTSCGLGGGCGLGELCGVISGGTLVVGLKYGQHDLEDNVSKANCRAKRDEFVGKFTQMHGSVTCRGLLGFDILTEEGEEKYMSLFANRTTAPCVKFVKDAAQILADLDY